MCLLALALAVNGLVAFNAAFHDPLTGYDAEAHLRYADALSRLRLPAREDSYEFFSPPLPYVVPAVVLALERAARGGSGPAGEAALSLAGDAWQAMNLIVSIGLTLAMLALCEAIRPADRALKRLSIALLGCVPLYYKSFAQPRAEPLLALLILLLVSRWVRAVRDVEGRLSGFLLLGAIAGLAALARQWAFFALGAAALCALAHALRDPDRGATLVKGLAAAAIAAALIGGWFYLHLWIRHGSPAAFNQDASRGFRLSNQPASFYADLGLGRLFSDPVRPAFPNRLWPTLYADAWGDYWCYFLVAGAFADEQGRRRYVSGSRLETLATGRASDPRVRTNREAAARYLGRVNALALAPTALLLLGAAAGAARLRAFVTGAAPPAGSEAILALLFAMVAVTAAGFLWFVIAFPDPAKGGMLKATYLLQALPPLAILGADRLLRLRSRRSVFALVVTMLALAAAHNAGAFVSRYNELPLPLSVDQASTGT